MCESFTYSKFIEKLTELDTDEDCCLTEAEYCKLMTDLPIKARGNYQNVCFRGLKNRKTNTIGFNEIRNIYEAANDGYKSKAMLLILFRGVAHKRDKRLSLDEFMEMCQIVDEKFNYDERKATFEKLDEAGTGRIGYPRVARELFNIIVLPNENPFKEIIQVRSPHTGCCEIA